MQRSGHGPLCCAGVCACVCEIRLTRRTSARQQWAHKVRGGRSAMLLREGEGRLLITQPPLAGPWPASSPGSSHRFGKFHSASACDHLRHIWNTSGCTVPNPANGHSLSVRQISSLSLRSIDGACSACHDSSKDGPRWDISTDVLHDSGREASAASSTEWSDIHEFVLCL
jgi:hypothetical protein